MLRFYIIADERRNGNGEEMTKAVVQMKETWVASKRKVLLANRFKCEIFTCYPLPLKFSLFCSHVS